MTVRAPTAIDWRVGWLRALLGATVHSAALWSTLQLAAEMPAAWILVTGVLLSAAAECIGWLRARRHRRTLVLIAGGLEIDGLAFRARRAWLGPGWTAVRLGTAKHRRLLHVMRDEVTAADHAALRRHLKSLTLD
jgi:hypothetical protein